MRNTIIAIVLGLGAAACMSDGGQEAPAVQVAPGEITAELILDRVP